MNHRIIRSDSFESKTWQGGTTKELFIFPPEALYAQRNFQFRLSTATVDVDRSDFTSLPGVSRKLMVLTGKTTLYHSNHHSRELNKYEVDLFEGDWVTSSIGKCTDFNLMTTGKTKSELLGLDIKKEQTLNYELTGDSGWLFIYIYSGSIRTEINNKEITIKKGDLLILENPKTFGLAIKGIENSELVFIEITSAPRTNLP